MRTARPERAGARRTRPHGEGGTALRPSCGHQVSWPADTRGWPAARRPVRRDVRRSGHTAPGPVLRPGRLRRGPPPGDPLVGAFRSGEPGGPLPGSARLRRPEPRVGQELAHQLGGESCPLLVAEPLGVLVGVARPGKLRREAACQFLPFEVPGCGLLPSARRDVHLGTEAAFRHRGNQDHGVAPRELSHGRSQLGWVVHGVTVATGCDSFPSVGARGDIPPGYPAVRTARLNVAMAQAI